MTMKRRGFLGAMLAACAAPAVIRSGILMPVKAGELVTPDREILVSSSLVPGDVITIAGVRGRFVIKAVSGSGVLQIGGAA